MDTRPELAGLPAAGLLPEKKRALFSHEALCSGQTGFKPSERQHMLSLPPFLLKRFVRQFLFMGDFRITAITSHRKAMERFPMPLPRGIHRSGIVTDGIRGEWLAPRRPGKGVVLYLHGGAYCFGSCATHRELAARLAKTTGMKTLLIDYRLAPEHPFPAAQDDALAAWNYLLEAGHAPEDIVVAGDSAGGNLALSLALRLRDEGRAVPAALVLLSPWTDLTINEETEVKLAHRDPMVSKGFGIEAASAYLAGRDASHPHLSPVFADMTGMPPMLIHVGTEEILLEDAQRLAEKAAQAGVEVELKVWDGMWHVFHLFGAVLSHARRAHREIGRFARSRVGNRRATA